MHMHMMGTCLGRQQPCSCPAGAQARNRRTHLQQPLLQHHMLLWGQHALQARVRCTRWPLIPLTVAGPPQ